ncbi:serine/threonine protein kinase [Kribbella pittospori]|uniref:Serine/threonine protein kinase n=1 Tax=Kribbella pittospori TaxID=722689 RepID=A0A4V2MA59_9ACTN|nr:serine/threonine-protein kinase [Kribbella pittospori]TCC58002.1 serine/threonine protein kinase [Kribbella pittospori]
MTTQAGDPTTIGSFAIQGRLGSGAMGSVYLARSPGGRLVAVKVVRDELADDARFRARFAREIEAARRVSGAFTAAVVDADPDAEHPWLATEYLPGPTLQRAIETSGPMTPAGVQALAGGLAEALVAIHRCGLVHRDLKPSNIVLTGNGPRVIDFGIARALEEVSLTATGLVIGTPGYLSPEQITGTSIGPPSDVFALGAVLVFAASGRGPFATGNPASLLHRIVHEQPHIPPLPSPLHDAVRHCLAQDPAQRPTPTDLLHLLGSPANTGLLAPPADTIRLPPPPTKLLPEPPPPVQHHPGVPHADIPQPPPAQPGGATFATSRTRSSIIATIATILFLAFTPQDSEFTRLYPGPALIFAVLDLVCLWFAIRHWIFVLRRRVELRLTPHGMTVIKGSQQVAIPWQAVTRLRVAGDPRRPWLIAWIDPLFHSALPAPRRNDHGGIRLYPIAHGATHKRRMHQLNELRAALNWYAGYRHDNSP